MVMVRHKLSRIFITGLAFLVPAFALPFALAQSIATGQLPDPVLNQAAIIPAASLLPASPALSPEYAVASTGELGTADKARFYLHRVAGFGTVFGPAVEAAAVLASPPKAYPNEWRQGVAAYGRNYGAVLGRAQTAEFTRFVTGAVLREDPRYYPSGNRAVAARIAHAIWFTLVDRSDSGGMRPAFANLLGATAGGFVGDAYLPSAYTDLRHVGVRTGVQLGGFAIENGFEEFVPELKRLTHALSSRFQHKD
jgi:hypothetical protein